MKGTLKKVAVCAMSAVLACGAVVGFASCDSSSGSSNKKIVVFTLKDGGSIATAVKGFLGSISEDLGFSYDVRFAGSDAATFLSNVNTALAEGYNGIISMTDKGNTDVLIEKCAEAEAYIGMTWSNQGSTLNSSDAGYDILTEANYVGSIADGLDTYDFEVAEWAEAIATKYKALPEADRAGSIAITCNTASWTPGHQHAAYNMMKTLVETYEIPLTAFATTGLSKQNGTSWAGWTVPDDDYAWAWPSGQSTAGGKLPQSYFEQNTNIRFVSSFASITFIEPIRAANVLRSDCQIWCSGYEDETYLYNNFGDGKTYQGFRTAPIEDVAFPLVQILDKLEGKSYSDKDSAIQAYKDGTLNKFALKGKLIPYSSSIIVMNSAQLTSFRSSYVYGNGKGENSIVTAQELKNLMVTYNESATYADLVNFFGGTDYTSINTNCHLNIGKITG